MNAEMTNLLYKQLTKSFSAALLDNDVINKIGEMLEAKASDNEADEQQVQQTKLTVVPKILITYASPGSFHVNVRIPAKKTEIVTGEAEAEFSCNENGEIESEEDSQQDLPGLNGGQNPGSRTAPEGEQNNE